MFQVMLFNINKTIYHAFLSNKNNVHRAVWFQKINIIIDNNNNNHFCDFKL